MNSPTNPADTLGAPGKPIRQLFGLGCCDDQGPLAAGVYSMLAAGSPRLALAKARGVPLAPYMINVRATFPDTTGEPIPDVGSDIKIVQDTLIDALVVRVQNESVTANQNQLQTLSDFFYGFTSGIEAKLTVQGAPRYDVAPKFVPLSNLADVVTGGSHWPGGWVLTYQQQLKMDFNAKILLPFAPIEVVCSFRAWSPVTNAFVTMSTQEAIDKLQSEFNIQLAQAYIDRVLAL
jgi:hypothetical protein